MVNEFSNELDNPGKLDTFIMNMKYKDYVQCAAQDERHQIALRHKHRGNHLLETLNAVLMNSDSPARADTRFSRPVRALTTPSRETTPSVPRQPSRVPTYNARVDQIGASSPELTGTSGTGSREGSSGASDRTDPEEYYDYDCGVPGDDSPQPFTNYDETCINLLEIDVPDCEEAPNKLLAFDVYRQAVQNLCKPRCCLQSALHRMSGATSF